MAANQQAEVSPGQRWRLKVRSQVLRDGLHQARERGTVARVGVVQPSKVKLADNFGRVITVELARLLTDWERLEPTEAPSTKETQ